MQMWHVSAEILSLQILNLSIKAVKSRHIGIAHIGQNYGLEWILGEDFGKEVKLF